MNVTIYSMKEERYFIPFPVKKIFTLLQSLTGLPLCHLFKTSAVLLLIQIDGNQFRVMPIFFSKYFLNICCG